MISFTSINTVRTSSKLSQKNKFLQKKGKGEGGGGGGAPPAPPSKSADDTVFYI